MSDQPLITPTNIADQLGVTPITLRRWCQYHAAHLSPLANPKAGQAKRFTFRDFEVLKHVRSLRDQGMTTQIINEQLADLTFPEIDQDQPADQPSDDQPDDQVTAVTAPQAAPLATLDGYAIEQILVRVDRLERSNKSSYYLIAIGVLIGLGLALVFELAAMIAAHVR